ncbi:MAG: dihydrolipoyl dehydrogenase family protein [Cyclobacteriaceae bacterium]
MHYDLIVIGAGSAGLYISIAMNQLGFKVLLIDREEIRFGGDCLNDGCVPSKSLIHVARMVHHARKSRDFGLAVSGKADLQKVMNYVYERQDQIRAHENPAHLQGEGIATLIGEASFIDNNTVKVNEKIYRAKRFVIATGSRPIIPDINGLDQADYLTNESIFELQHLPKKLLVVGGGPLGIELAQAFARLGTEVAVVTDGDRILEKEEREMSHILQNKLEEEGLRFHFNASCQAFVSGSEALIKRKDGSSFHLRFDKVLFAVGRQLSHHGLNLQAAGIEQEKGKIKLNKYLQTTNPKVFVAGDAAGQLKFSHASELHGKLLLNNFLSPLKKKISYRHFSWVTFTDPEVATFGLNEVQLRQQKIKYERLVLNFDEDDRAVIEDYRYGRLILYTSKAHHPLSSTKIYGGSMMAPHAGEMVQELILADAAGIGSSKIFDKIYPYPVASRVNQGIFLERTLSHIGPAIRKMLRWLY